MTNDERADRRERIRTAYLASNNRVQDFVELIAGMCADRTRAKKACANYLRTGTPAAYDMQHEEEQRDSGRLVDSDERALVCA